MQEYLAPGVYVEEIASGPRPIAGVSTSTAGFVGPTRFGPTSGEPALLTSFLDFERIYGGLDRLDHGAPHPNDMAQSVRGFFENGGRRLYVARVFESSRRSETDDAALTEAFPDHGLCVMNEDLDDPEVVLRARWPGAAGNLMVTFELTAGSNVLVGNRARARLDAVAQWDTVLVRSAADSSSFEPQFYVVESGRSDQSGTQPYVLVRDGKRSTLPELVASGKGVEIRVVTITVTVQPLGEFMDTIVGLDLSPDPRHSGNSLSNTFAAEPDDPATGLHVPLVVDLGELRDGMSVVEAVFAEMPRTSDQRTVSVAEAVERTLVVGAMPVCVKRELTSGTDGKRPRPAAYEGTASSRGERSGLAAFEHLDDISVVAAPGSSRDGKPGRSFAAESRSIAELLIRHVERMRHRVAVVDPPDEASVDEVRRYRANFDSTWAALYYPWVEIADPMTAEAITIPPSGILAGIYARTDIERGVHKAPANEVVRLATGFELPIDHRQQDVLNPEGVNCLRFLDHRGHCVWGVRTMSSDPEWKYVNLRRYGIFIEESIDRGMQWVVFEPNGPALWERVRGTIGDFLLNEFRSSRLPGTKPEDAFFVRCDRSTITQDDLDNGRLVCLVGIAPVRPAEFVIFRIGQKTFDA